MSEISQEEFDVIERDATEEIAGAIRDMISDDTDLKLTVSSIQPPESVIQAMSKAAAQVLVSFEHGYQMADDSDD